MNWLYRFMYGRYGADQLTFALIILYLILSLTLTLIPVPLIWLLAYIPMVFCFYRMLSRNIAKRQAENWAFLRVWNPVKNWFKSANQNFKAHQEYKYFKCPNCKQKLRAPEGGKNPGHLPEMQASVYQKGIKSGPPKLRGPLFCCSFYGLCLSETVIFKFILFQIG